MVVPLNIVYENLKLFQIATAAMRIATTVNAIDSSSPYSLFSIQMNYQLMIHVFVLHIKYKITKHIL
jgi:hypothetical protein